MAFDISEKLPQLATSPVKLPEVVQVIDLSHEIVMAGDASDEIKHEAALFNLKVLDRYARTISPPTIDEAVRRLEDANSSPGGPADMLEKILELGRLAETGPNNRVKLAASRILGRNSTN